MRLDVKKAGAIPSMHLSSRVNPCSMPGHGILGVTGFWLERKEHCNGGLIDASYVSSCVSGSSLRPGMMLVFIDVLQKYTDRVACRLAAW